MRRCHALLLACMLVCSLSLAPGMASAQEVTVMAAASLTDAMRQLGQIWAAKGHTPPRFAYGASSALARQIEQGAPADIFASADEPWADYLQQRDLLTPGTRSSPLGNTLVLIAPAPGPDNAAPTPLSLSTGVDLLARLGPDGHLATGDPDSVPVGRYAEAALKSLGVWTAVAPRIARAENVRAALLLVERGEAPLGIVYGTDAAASTAVRVIATFPAASHPPITYPFALTRHGDTPAARALLAFLTGPEAAPVYRKLGFIINE